MQSSILFSKPMWCTKFTSITVLTSRLVHQLVGHNCNKLTNISLTLKEHYSQIIFYLVTAMDQNWIHSIFKNIKNK